MHAATTPRKIVQRARIVLLAGQGVPNQAIARAAGTSRPTVLLWRRRFAEGGVAALLHERPRPGRRPRLSAEAVRRLIDATLQTTPAGASQWSVRSMARAQGVGRTTIHRIWRQYGLRPHRTEPAAARDAVQGPDAVAGVYFDPPTRALLVSGATCRVERDAGGGDVRRHRPSPLLAALRRLDQKLVRTDAPREGTRGLLRFLGRTDRATRGGAELHLVLGGTSACGSEQVQRWLRGHPRVRVHFGSTRESWLGLVEDRLGAEAADASGALVAAIERHLDPSIPPRRFTWTTCDGGGPGDGRPL